MSTGSLHEGAAVSTMTRGMTSTMSPSELLQLSARLARRLLRARRATILLIDEGGCLVPEVSVAHDADEEMLARFRDMAPIPLREMPGAWELLLAGEVVVIPHAAESLVVPSTWRDAFGLQALAIAPLVLEGEPCGALVVEAEHPAVLSTPSLIRAMGSIAAMTAVSVGDAKRRRRDTARLVDLENLRDALRLLARTSPLEDLAEVALDALLQLVGGERGGVVVGREPDAVHVLARRQVLRSTPELPWVKALVRSSRACSVVRTDGPEGARLLVVPLALEEGHVGGCLVELPTRTRLTPEQLQVAELLGHGLARELLRAASEREQRLRARCREEAEELARVDPRSTVRPDFPALLAHLSTLLRTDAGVEVVDVALVDPVLSRAARLPRPAAGVTSVLRSWSRRSGPPQTMVRDDTWLVPLLEGGTPLGCVRFRVLAAPPFGHDRAALLSSVAGQLSRLLVGERAHLADAAVAAAEAEREAWRAELRLAAASVGEGGNDPLLGVLLRALARTEVRREPFHLALAQLVRDNVPAGVRAKAQVRGAAHRTRPETEALLWRLCTELVPALSARSRATRVDAALELDHEQAVLTLQDDGLPLGHRCAGGTGLFPLLRRLAHLCEEAGGQLSVHNVVPLGVEAVARLPLADASLPRPRRSDPPVPLDDRTTRTQERP